MQGMKKIINAIVCALLLESALVAAFVTPHGHPSAHRSVTNRKDSKPSSPPRTQLMFQPNLGRGANGESTLLDRQKIKLHVNKSDQSSTLGTEDKNLLPSIFFLLSAASLGKLAIDIYSSSLPMTIGIWSLFFTTIAVGYDNFIIGLGKPFFSDAETNKKKYDLLKVLSFPRFTAHAVLVPFLYTTGAEIGRAAGISWLQGDYVQTLLIVAAAALGIISRVRFVNSPGIEIADTSDSPVDALENDLLWFTYKEPEFLYIIPSIVLSIFNLAIGVAAFGGDFRGAAIWMFFSGVAVLYGNAKPSYVSRFTGNLAEVVMLWAIYEAASLTL